MLIAKAYFGSIFKNSTSVVNVWLKFTNDIVPEVLCFEIHSWIFCLPFILYCLDPLNDAL